MKIVKASSKNIDEIVNVEANCGYHKNPVKTELKKLFVDFFNLTHPYAYVLKDNNKIIGYFAFRKIRRDCELDYIAIIHRYQGKGLAKLSLNKLILLCKKSNINKINLSVRNSNKKAINLYKKYGFKTVIKSKNKFFMVKELK